MKYEQLTKLLDSYLDKNRIFKSSEEKQKFFNNLNKVLERVKILKSGAKCNEHSFTRDKIKLFKEKIIKSVSSLDAVIKNIDFINWFANNLSSSDDLKKSHIFKKEFVLCFIAIPLNIFVIQFHNHMHHTILQSHSDLIC